MTMTHPYFKAVQELIDKAGVTVPEVTQEEYKLDVKLTEKYAPLVLPVQWTQMPFPVPLIKAYLRSDGLKVLISVSRIMAGDGKTWIHVSLSRESRLPTYEDMVSVKKLFVGDDRQALQIFPPKAKHINHSPNVLHLWCCVEGDGLPDFGRFGTI